jgi:hypothetical protein
VFYSVALQELGVAPDACRQLRPGAFTMTDRTMRKALDLCESAPHENAVWGCQTGVKHSYEILKSPGVREWPGVY